MKYIDPAEQKRKDWIFIILMLIWLSVSWIFLEPKIFISGNDWDTSMIKHFLPGWKQADAFFPGKESFPENGLTSWSYENEGLVMWSSFWGIKDLFAGGYYGVRFPKPFVLECILDDAEQFSAFLNSIDENCHFMEWESCPLRNGNIYVQSAERALKGIYINSDSQIVRYLYIADWDNRSLSQLDSSYVVFGGGGHHPSRTEY